MDGAGVTRSDQKECSRSGRMGVNAPWASDVFALGFRRRNLRIEKLKLVTSKGHFAASNGMDVELEGRTRWTGEYRK